MANIVSYFILCKPLCTLSSEYVKYYWYDLYDIITKQRCPKVRTHSVLVISFRRLAGNSSIW